MNRFRQQQRITTPGFTLVELMVAMAISLLIILAVGSVFVGSRQSYQDNEGLSRMQENARFALEVITSDLKHAGFVGELADPAELVIDAALSGAIGHSACAGGLFVFNNAGRYWLVDYGRRIADVETHPQFSTCFDFTDADAIANGTLPRAGTSLLSIKRVDSEPVAAREASRVYVHAEFETGDLTDGVNPLNPNGGDDWEYIPRVYYLDENTNLRRSQLIAGPVWASELVAEGIEAFHVEFGVDSNLDGVVDGFLNIADDADSFALADMSNAMIANVYVLARSQRGTHARDYADRKTYSLGSLVVDYSDPAVNPAPVDPDNGRHFMRKVYSTTVVLRNLRNQTVIRGLGL